MPSVIWRTTVPKFVLCPPLTAGDKTAPRVALLLTMYDIAHTIMNKKKLNKIKQAIREMQVSPQGRKSEDLTSIASQLGRKLFNRGKEPTYVKEIDPCLSPPLSIPNHPGDMAIGTVRSILNQLLSDCDEWEMHLETLEEAKNDED